MVEHHFYHTWQITHAFSNFLFSIANECTLHHRKKGYCVYGGDLLLAPSRAFLTCPAQDHMILTIYSDVAVSHLFNTPDCPLAANVIWWRFRGCAGEKPRE